MARRERIVASDAGCSPLGVSIRMRLTKTRQERGKSQAEDDAPTQFEVSISRKPKEDDKIAWDQDNQSEGQERSALTDRFRG